MNKPDTSIIKYLKWTPDNVALYKSEYNMLCHANTDDDYDGFLAINENTGRLIGYATWRDDFLTGFEVAEQYRGQGYGTIFLKRAISSGIRQLSVFHSNDDAINLYIRNGFMETRREGKMVYMSLKPKMESLKTYIKRLLLS